MSRLKRSAYFVVVFDDRQVVDLGAFLRGRVRMSTETVISVISPVAEEAHVLNRDQLELLAGVPADWTERSRLTAEGAVAEEHLDDLVTKGLLISDAEGPDTQRFRLREEAFVRCQWDPSAAFYNLLIKHPGGLDKDGDQIIDVAAIATAGQQSADDFIARHGTPPSPFHDVPGDGESVQLPRTEKRGDLYQALSQRKTVRAFDTGRPMSVEDLATVLYYVFGCHGHTTLTRGAPVLRKNSPSGGSLHPVEVYPLVMNVAGVDTGLYHYRVRDHSLVRLRQLETWEAEAMAVNMAAGHGFAEDAHVILLMTARFHRNFWKYRRNARTYSVILQDAAHLSQTFYLVCSDLGLGSFYVAFNGSAIEEALGLDGIEEGAVALAGCGIRLSDGLEHSLDFDPYTPGETEI